MSEEQFQSTARSLYEKLLQKKIAALEEKKQELIHNPPSVQTLIETMEKLQLVKYEGDHSEGRNVNQATREE